MVPENTENANRVGIPYALDDEGKRVAAYDALSHTTYLCPYCLCKVFRRENHKGTCSFVRYKGQKHRDQRCQKIEETGKYHSFSASESPVSLIGPICHCSTPRVQKKVEDLPQKYSSSNSTSISADELHAIVYSSLKQIYEAGLDSMRPYERFGKYTLSDYFLHFKWAKLFFDDKKSYNLGARILQVGITSYNLERKYFLFTIYFGRNRSVRFVLQAKTSSVYKAILDKLYSKESCSISNKLYRPKKTTQALIAGIDWEYIDRCQCKGYYCKSSEEYCTNCCGLYAATAVTPKQVFPIPLSSK